MARFDRMRSCSHVFVSDCLPVLLLPVSHIQFVDEQKSKLTKPQERWVSYCGYVTVELF